MKKQQGTLQRYLLAAGLSLTLLAPQISVAAVVEEDPSMLAMTTDLVIIRPVMLGVTILGSAVWLVSLPFSAIAGTEKQALDTLVVGPAETTFVRCLGCTKPGKHPRAHETAPPAETVTPAPAP